jgi:hypothetical protein
LQCVSTFAPAGTRGSPKAPIDDHVFLGHFVGQDQQCGLRRGDAALFGDGSAPRDHAVDGPVQVDGSGPRAAQQAGDAFEIVDETACMVRRIRLGAEGQPVCRGNADGRRPAHLHRRDGAGDVLRCPARDAHGFVRQPRLVDQEQGPLWRVVFEGAHERLSVFRSDRPGALAARRLCRLWAQDLYGHHQRRTDSGSRARFD